MTGAMLKSARPAGQVFIREPSFGEDYVRKDTFDAHMQRIEALMERNLIEQRAMNERLNTKLDSLRDEMKRDVTNLRTELKGDMASLRTELKGDIKALDAKVYALEGRLSQNLVITGIIVTIFGLIITAIQFWK